MFTSLIKYKVDRLPFFERSILEKHEAKINAVFSTDDKRVNITLVPRAYGSLGRQTDEDLTQPKSFAACPNFNIIKIVVRELLPSVTGYNGKTRDSLRRPGAGEATLHSLNYIQKKLEP